MSTPIQRPPQRVPTLTEVVQAAPAPALEPVPSIDPAPDDAALAQRVLLDVQRQIDLMLEYRLREALGPLLARLSESLIVQARDELASTLRDVVARAVAQEIARHRGR
jgi:hypothetical protein